MIGILIHSIRNEMRIPLVIRMIDLSNWSKKMPWHLSHQQLLELTQKGRVVRDLSGVRLQIGPPAKQPKPQRTAAFRRPDLNNLYLRSAWEANYARYLNWLQSLGKIDHWEYEVDEFEFPVKRGRAKYYKPDFKVWLTPSVFEYHEVKGYMDTVSATKLKRMQRYYPQFKIVLIDKHAYQKIIVPIRSLLPGYESEKAYASR
jgi:hypothetical protein